MDTIARRGSFSAPAKELFRVPSTISYTVSKLEEDLGVQLFERFGPRVTLPRGGEELLKEGRSLLKAARDLECRVRRVASGWETEFSIAMDSMLSPAGLVKDIEAFYEIADQTRVRIVKEQLSGSWEALLDRRADLLIGAAGEGPSGGGYTAIPIGRMSFVFVVAPTHPRSDPWCGHAGSSQKAGSVPVRLQNAQHNYCAVQRHYGIVTSDSGIVTADSGEGSKSVTFVRNGRSR